MNLVRKTVHATPPLGKRGSCAPLWTTRILIHDFINTFMCVAGGVSRPFGLLPPFPSPATAITVRLDSRRRILGFRGGLLLIVAALGRVSLGLAEEKPPLRQGPARLSYLENGLIRVGVDLDRG